MQEPHVDVKKVEFYYLGPYKAIDDLLPYLVRSGILKNRRRTSGHSYGVFFLLEIFHHLIVSRQTIIAFLANGNTWETQKRRPLMSQIYPLETEKSGEVPRTTKKVAGIR